MGAVVAIPAIAAGGEGVGRRAEGRAVFVARTAPGERIRLREGVKLLCSFTPSRNRIRSPGAVRATNTARPSARRPTPSPPAAIAGIATTAPIVPTLPRAPRAARLTGGRAVGRSAVRAVPWPAAPRRGVRPPRRAAALARQAPRRPGDGRRRARDR